MSTAGYRYKRFWSTVLFEKVMLEVKKVITRDQYIF